MHDSTAGIRRDMITTGQTHADLAAEQGQTWDTQELTRDFEVLGLAAPFVVVRRRSDGQMGSLEFTTARASTSAGGPTMRRRHGYYRPMSGRRLRRYLWCRIVPWAIRWLFGWR